VWTALAILPNDNVFSAERMVKNAVAGRIAIVRVNHFDGSHSWSRMDHIILNHKIPGRTVRKTDGAKMGKSSEDNAASV
jgi:hypothetical protein